MKTVKILVLGFLIIFPVVFVVQNLQPLTYSESLKLNLLFTKFESPKLPVGLLLLCCFAVGYFAAFILGFAEKRRLKKSIKGLQIQRSRIEEELNSLRNLPITGEQSAYAEIPGLNGGGVEGGQ